MGLQFKAGREEGGRTRSCEGSHKNALKLDDGEQLVSSNNQGVLLAGVDERDKLHSSPFDCKLIEFLIIVNRR